MKWVYYGRVYIKPVGRGVDLIVDGENRDISDVVSSGEYVALIKLERVDNPLDDVSIDDDE